MLIASRQSFWKGGMSAKSYVQDSLVAMWDGIENVAFGEHDSTSRIWKDLTGNGYDVDRQFNSYVSGEFDDNSLVVKGKTAAYGNKPLPYNADYHIEICIDYGHDLNQTNEQHVLIDGGGSTDGTHNRTSVWLSQLEDYNRNGIVYSVPNAYITQTTNWGNYFLPQKMIISANIDTPYINNVLLPITQTLDFASSAYPKNITIGAGAGAGRNVDPDYNFNGFPPIGTKFHSIRVYARHLSAQERIKNSLIDEQRFFH